MKKVAIILGATVAAFLAGVVGVYFLLPTVAPDTVVAALRADSLAAQASVADSTAEASPADVSPVDVAAFLADSSFTALQDSVAVTDSTAGVPARPSIALDLHKAIVRALRDSLEAVRAQVIAADEEKAGVMEELQAMKTAQTAQEEHRMEIQNLSKTLAKLDEKELKGVLEQLDLSTLETLYGSASSREQQRLLQAMAPARAAGFVQRLVRPKGEDPASAVPAQTVSDPQSSVDAGEQSPLTTNR